MTTCGAAACTARSSAAASNTSTTTGSAPSARSAAAFAGERVVPTTSWPAATQQRHQPTPDRPTCSGQKYFHGTMLTHKR